MSWVVNYIFENNWLDNLNIQRYQRYQKSHKVTPEYYINMDNCSYYLPYKHILILQTKKSNKRIIKRINKRINKKRKRI